MDLNLSGKKALITGGAVGIGRAIALELAREGVEIFLTSRNEEHIARTRTVMAEAGLGDRTTFRRIDLTEPEAPGRLAADMAGTFGWPDIVVNNAGSALGITDPYCSLEDWRAFFRINLEVPLELNNLCLPAMKARGHGRVVNITSGAGLENSGPVPYCASKAALTAYTRSMGRVLAVECPGVVMTAVMPGVVATEDGHWGGKHALDSEHAKKYLAERCPVGRFGRPEEIAPLVAFLCSKLASFCHGGIYPVDAGQAKHYMYYSYL